MAEELDADRISDLLLPLDGPHDPDAVVQTATAVAELVRRLNHATFHRMALHYPSQLYQVVGGLRTAMHGLDQTLQQLATRLGQWAADPLVGHDHGYDSSATCVEAAEQLHRAAAALGAVTRPLDAAYGLTSHLYVDNADHAPRAFPPMASPSPATPSLSPPQHSPTSSTRRAR